MMNVENEIFFWFRLNREHNSQENQNTVLFGADSVLIHSLKPKSTISTLASRVSKIAQIALRTIHAANGICRCRCAALSANHLIHVVAKIPLWARFKIFVSNSGQLVARELFAHIGTTRQICSVFLATLPGLCPRHAIKTSSFAGEIVECVFRTFLKF